MWDQPTQDPLPTECALLRAVLDHCPSLIFVKDLKGHYIEANRAFEVFCQTPRTRIIGRTDWDLFPTSQAMRFRDNDAQVLRVGHPMEFEEEALLADGPHLSIVDKFPLRQPNGTIYAIGGITTDITQRNLTEQELRHTKQALETMLRQRQQLDDDLHDHSLQLLLAAGLALTEARHLLHTNVPAADETIHTSLVMLNRVIQDLRRHISHHPPTLLTHKEFRVHIHHSIQLLTKNTPLKYHVQLDPHALEALPLHTLTHLQAIIHEVVSNSLRHSQAEQGILHLQVLAGTVHLTLRDQGIGFDCATPRRQGYGLTSLQSRAETIGATLEIASAPQQGTTITLTFPAQPTTHAPHTDSSKCQCTCPGNDSFSPQEGMLITPHSETLPGPDQKDSATWKLATE